MAQFLMPSLGADMRAGTLVSWLKKPGDRVARGDIIAEVETDKGDIDVEVFTSGVVEKLLVAEGTKVPVGTPLATIAEEAGVAAPPAGEPIRPAQPPAPAPIPPAHRERAAESRAPRPAGAPPRRIRVSPAARRLARELGVDVATLTGTGPGGAVSLEDVRAAAAPAPAPAPAAEAPPAPAADARARMRIAIAAAMARSKHDIPHYYVSTTINFSPVARWLEQHNAGRPPDERLIAGILFVKATALALRDFPDLNGRWEHGAVVRNPAIHVGTAIALRGGGLVAPALHDADRNSLGALMAALRDLVTRVRRGQLRGSELTDPTITVTSMGERGVETVFGIINPPQVAILGFGKVVKRPWVVDGDALAARPVVTIALSADHRVSDGREGGQFLSRIEQLLSEPESL